jgi:hypothetical protein
VIERNVPRRKNPIITQTMAIIIPMLRFLENPFNQIIAATEKVIIAAIE